MKYFLLTVCIFFALSVTAQNNIIVAETRYPFTGRGSNGIFITLMPEFYKPFPTHNKDTTWKYECYDSRDSVISIDTVQSINDVRYISLFKSFTDSAHTYKDSNGRDQLLPASSIIQRYDRTGKDKWLSINYANNKYTELKEYPGEIVKTDTIMVTDPITGKGDTIFYKYYKVIPLK